MQTIKYAIKDFMQGLQKQQVSPKSSPEWIVRSVLSRKDLGHVRLGYFKKGVLSLEVDSSARLYLLNLGKQELLEKLSKKLGGLKEIRFRLGAAG